LIFSGLMLDNVVSTKNLVLKTKPL
jgi:hypothetical protein